MSLSITTSAQSGTGTKINSEIESSDWSESDPKTQARAAQKADPVLIIVTVTVASIRLLRRKHARALAAGASAKALCCTLIFGALSLGICPSVGERMLHL